MVQKISKAIVGFMLAVAFTAAIGCITIGRPFPVGAVYQIKMGETTRTEINRLFGNPWRTGIDNDRKTWTYAHYRYTLFGGPMTRDLVVRFDDKGVVVSYTFNSTYPQDNR
jgi:hypothetical protein